LPGQHGVPDEGDDEVPGLPHTTQRLELLQTVPASEHLLPAQQGCPGPPQGTQVEPLHVVPASRHAVPDEQQDWPVAPHALQTVALTPELVSDMHWVPGSVHVLLEQHGLPAFPQAEQTEFV
jgi:hypothetical protein